MANNKNRYAQQTHKSELMQVLKGEASAKGKIGSSALLSLKDLVVVVIGGGVLGAVSGKLALPIGFVMTGAGHYTDSKLLQLVGVGAMASNSFSKTSTNTVSGMDGLDGVKERLQAYREALKEKFFLDKMMKKKETPATGGFGEVQYFTYPESGMNGDLAALDAIEQQLTESALQFQGTLPDYQVGVTEDYQTGNVPDYQIGDIEERLY